jgi:hypothetical protein
LANFYIKLKNCRDKTMPYPGLKINDYVNNIEFHPSPHRAAYK